MLILSVAIDFTQVKSIAHDPAPSPKKRELGGNTVYIFTFVQLCLPLMFALVYVNIHRAIHWDKNNVFQK